MISFNAKFVKATSRVVVELFQSIVKISGYFIHVSAVWFREFRVCVAQACSHWLVHKNHVVIFDPAVLVFYDLVWRRIGGFDEMRTQFHEVS
jgi:hypothetical protein